LKIETSLERPEKILQGVGGNRAFLEKKMRDCKEKGRTKRNRATTIRKGGL